MECFLSYPCPPPSLPVCPRYKVKQSKEARVRFIIWTLLFINCLFFNVWVFWGRVDNCHLFMVVIYILFEIRIWICCVCHWYLSHIVFVFLVVFVFVACVQAGVWWGRVGFLSAGSICPQVRCSQARIKMIRISHRITMWSWCWWPPKVAKKDLQKKEMIGVSVAFISYLMAIVDDFQVDEIVHCLPHLLSIP